MDPDTNQLKFITSTVCKNILRKGCNYSSILKRINDIIKGVKCNFIEQNC